MPFLWPKSRSFPFIMAYSVPVLFLTFNRPQHTRVVLERLRQIQPQRLYVHCDGPRPQHPADLENVQQVRAVIETLVDWPCEVHTLFREQNMGLREGVYDAINWFFGQESEGVILEDDCVPDPTFFRFCEEMLREYRHNTQIMHIGGSNLAQRYTLNLPESFVFSKFSFVWGWASWKRAWEKMSISLDGLEAFAASTQYQQFVSNNIAKTYMLDKFRTTQARKNNSWAYAWFYSILKNNGLCIVPKKNLVQNVGVGESTATNTRGADNAARLQAGSLEWPLIYPLDRVPKGRLEQHFFYSSQKKRHRLLLWWALKKIGLR